MQADGVSLFHAGDHSPLHDAVAFRREFDFLADSGLRADLLFLMVQAADDATLSEGVYFATNRLSAKALLPMHARGREHVYTEFARKAASDGIRVPIHCAEFGGDHFAIGGVAGGSVLGQAVHSANNKEAIDKLRDRDLQPERVMDVIGRRLCE